VVAVRCFGGAALRDGAAPFAAGAAVAFFGGAMPQVSQ